MALRGAIIGLGNVAVHGHLPGWLERPDVEIVSAADKVSARKQELQKHLPRARWYDSVDALVAGGALDFVDICTPPATHVGLIRTALHHGLHILCEKPLVSRREDLDAVSELLANDDRVVSTVHNWHKAPIIRKVGELLGQRAIGEIQRCTWQTLRTKPASAVEARDGNWRVDPAMAGGGVLMDHGWHAFYVLYAWMGQVPDRINARLESRRYTEWPIEDTATVRLEFPAATAEIFVTWASTERRNRARLEGTHGMIRIEDDTVVLVPSSGKEGEQRWMCPPSLSTGSHHPDWFRGVARDFVAEVTGGSPARGGSVAEASLCVTLEALAQESSRQGGAWLPVPGPLPLVAAR
ncbi:MAG: Gfo/Idh/MocA family protein [Candidatus Methylomirabilales bacterium]